MPRWTNRMIFRYPERPMITPHRWKCIDQSFSPSDSISMDSIDFIAAGTTYCIAGLPIAVGRLFSHFVPEFHRHLLDLRNPPTRTSADHFPKAIAGVPTSRHPILGLFISIESSLQPVLSSMYKSPIPGMSTISGFINASARRTL